MSRRGYKGDPLYDFLRYPGSGEPLRREEMTDRDDAWTELIKGQPLGKRIVMNYDAASADVQPFPIEFFQLGGFNRNAVQMQIALSSPFAIPRTQASLAGIELQNLSGEYGNIGTTEDYPGTVEPIIWPPVSALVEWGTNARAHAIVDAKNGTILNISASWIRVIGCFTADAANAPGTTGPYVLSAFASPGWPSRSSAQRTIYLGKIDSGDESDVFAVPPFARSATVIGCDPTGATVTTATLLFWQSPNGTHCVGTYFVSGNQPGPFAVPNGGQYFSVIAASGELSGSNALLYSVVFDLSI